MDQQVGTSATSPVGATSEVGPLRTVMLHRPGPELTRLTPRNNDQLLFDGVPWVARAQEEHDAFAEALRQRAGLAARPHGGGLGHAPRLAQPRGRTPAGSPRPAG